MPSFLIEALYVKNWRSFYGERVYENFCAYDKKIGRNKK